MKFQSYKFFYYKLCLWLIIKFQYIGEKITSMGQNFIFLSLKVSPITYLCVIVVSPALAHVFYRRQNIYISYVNFGIWDKITLSTEYSSKLQSMRQRKIFVKQS